MLPDWVSNPGPLTYESGALPTALRSPAGHRCDSVLGHTQQLREKDLTVAQKGMK